METSYVTGRFEKLAAIAVCVMAIVTCIVTPLRMIASGYVPDTDARRHAALVVSGKSLNDILVLKHEPFVDPSPGWHTVLRELHLHLGLQKHALVAFSVIALFLLLNICGLLWTRPEGWMLALALMVSSSMSIAHRLTLGRPLLFTASVVICLLFMWGEKDDKPRFRLGAITGATIALIAASVWIHGSWYLFLLLVAALLLTGQFKKAAMFAGCFALGCLAVACLTGSPLTFLSSPVSLTIGAFTRGIPKTVLVGEFQEFREPLTPLMIIAGMLIWRSARNKDAPHFARDPAFTLVLLCWLLGLNVARFWLDWGLPAMLVLCSREFNSALTPWLAGHPLRRLTLTLFACMAVFFLVSNDIDERWSKDTASAPPTEIAQSFGDWLPGEGGIVYSVYMRTFYDLFYWYPEGHWKYALAFEPGLMKDDDLATFINIRQYGYNSAMIRPWILKMRPEDRIVVTASRRPEIPELEWRYLHDTLWFGRLPRVPATGNQ